jgi:hydrogenase nickel incorporation protein HypA/HybF
VTVHEYSIVQALLDRVDAEVAAHGALAVHRLTVQVGEISGLDPDLFTTAFASCREGTACASAILDVERVPARWICPICAAPIVVGAPLSCPDCQAPARLAQGDEIILGRIEMEVPDVQDLRLR